MRVCETAGMLVAVHVVRHSVCVRPPGSGAHDVQGRANARSAELQV